MAISRYLETAAFDIILLDKKIAGKQNGAIS